MKCNEKVMFKLTASMVESVRHLSGVAPSVRPSVCPSDRPRSGSVVNVGIASVMQRGNPIPWPAYVPAMLSECRYTCSGIEICCIVCFVTCQFSADV